MVFVVGNAAAFTLEALVAGVQAMRLEYYELFGEAFEPIETRQRRFGLVRRIEFFFRRLLGR